MAKKTYSARLRKALDNEAKNIDILAIISRKDQSTKADVMRLTGLPKRDYDSIFVEDANKNWRGIRFDFPATAALSSHVDCMDITPTQKRVSSLLWKFVQFDAIHLISQQFTHITGRFIEEDYLEDEAFWDETYEISGEELEEVAEAVKKHLAEVSEAHENNMFNYNNVA